MNAIAPEYQEHADAFRRWDDSQHAGDLARDEAIRSGKVCPYCGRNTVLVDDAEVYHGQTYKSGFVYLCRPCEAWVGTHKRGNVALGRVAKQNLRTDKQIAHRVFDRLWSNWSKVEPRARQIAYLWLAERMNIHPDLCHIGFFDEAQCRQVVELCSYRLAQFDFDTFLERKRS